jgi:hypothetical protein
MFKKDFEILARGYLVRFQAVPRQAARSEYASGLPVVFRDQIVKDLAAVSPGVGT